MCERFNRQTKSPARRVPAGLRGKPMHEDEQKKPATLIEVRALAREAAAKVIEKWRSEGLSDAEIEKKLGRPLPPELRR